MRDVEKVTNSFLNNEVQLFVFRLQKDGDLFAVNIYKVREVIKYMGVLTPIDHSERSMMDGIITVRDETMPLIDLKRWFSYDSRAPEKSLKEEGVQGEALLVMICDFSDFIVGIRIYEADRIITKSWSDVNQVGEMGVKSGIKKITGNTKYIDGSIIQIVDVEKMLVDVFPWLEEEKEIELNDINSVESDKLILLAEDSPSAMKIMKKILDKLEVKHLDFVNGKLLLDYILSPSTDKDSIGLIITDLEMPEASGFEVIKQVKANKLTAHIPVVVNSSMSGDSNRNMAIKLNADGFISKSNPKEIEQIINELMISAAIE